ncbi:dephospho-CoA kinase [Amycolatopsis acidiphila]|uniref:Dephospho-CoA kinase n=1 Tax=Amycolatopsis acidiphila TaxID=715473 RepID=A0A557ZTJ8_9PSEU|nr:dephospho-CoA kinase [Amycolatopsis acidiphila]TVT15343.1 dephospho-CoA kinase [Amycolatopsis acidiphila]UIJ62222.1 dephospho-CoA kinase [Amycolatopsis acidiphila]GHG92707.1 dephospho-CoA kinase [Amycolatopsis acidiphila]
MLRVGLTGGIGAGKSTVAARLAEHGAVVIDADKIAREVVEPGTEGLAALAGAFGTDVLTAEGALDRPALAAKAFADEASRQRLNGILHPLIGVRTVELMAAAAPEAIVVHDVPLLVEGGMSANYHLVLVVDAPVEVRVRRLVETRGMPEADARARIAAQATEEQRRTAADVWLDNGGTPDLVQAEVDRLWADRLVPYEANIRLRRPRAPMSPKLSPYDEEWPAQAERVLARIRAAVGERVLRADHIGSTSVPGLPAKDIVDLQLTVSTLDEADAFADTLSDAGFPRAEGEWWDEPQDGSAGHWPKRFHFGGDPGRMVNLHVRSRETPAWRLALLFAAWLRANPAERDAYAEVKRKLAEDHAADGTVEAYAQEKQDWVDAAFRRAEAWAAATGWTP